MKKKLLIADNRVISRDVIRDTLSEEYEVFEAEDGHKALQILEERDDIDIVLLELLLPEINGLELLQMLRSKPKYRDIVIMIVTSVGEISDEVTALSLGADDYICKPFNPEVISARLKNILYTKMVLSKSESRFGFQRNILDGTTTAIYVVDAINYSLFYANKAAIELLKAEDCSYTGKKCYEFFKSRNHQCSYCKLFIAHTQNNVSEIYMPNIDKTVSIRVNIIEWLGRPAYVVYMLDVTEQKHSRELEAERYQKELLRRYRVDLDFMAYLVINVFQGTVMEHDPHGFPVPTISPGQPASEFVERVLPTVIDISKRKEFAELLDLKNLTRSFEEGKTLLSIDYRRYSRNEKYIMWARSTIQLMLDPKTKDLMAFLYTYDINESKLMQEIINASVQYDYNMIAYLNLYTAKAKLYAQNGTCINRIVKQEFDYAEAVQEYVDRCISVNLKDEVLNKMNISNIRRNLENNKTYQFDVEVNNKKGKKEKIRIRYANFDKVYGMILWTEVDITDTVESQNTKCALLLKKIEELQYANNIKNDYLSSISSKLKMSLRYISAIVKGTGAKSENIEIKEKIEEATVYIAQITEILNDIMDISNLENEKMKIPDEQFTLTDLLFKIKNKFKKSYKHKKIKFSIDQEVFHDSCIGGFKAINKVLNNILDNAFKYSNKNGEVTLLLYELPSANNEKGVYRFIIKDTGIGIEEQRLKHIFQPDGHGKNKSQSSGLGLAIAKGIIDKLNGKISVVSKYGEGTIVTIDLKLKLVQSNFIKKNEESHGWSEEKSIAGLRILIVAASPLTVLVVRRLLEQKGAYVYLAENEKNALELLDSNDGSGFDCLILDIDCWSEGMEGISKICRHQNVSNQAMIIGAFDTMNDTKKYKCIENGISDFLSKPLKFRSLLECLLNWRNKAN